MSNISTPTSIKIAHKSKTETFPTITTPIANRSPIKAGAVNLKSLQSTQLPTSATSLSPVKSSETDTISEDERKAMLFKANKILGKKHNSNICNTNQNSSWIMQCIKKAVTGSTKIMKQQKFRFEDGREAAKYNTKILKQCKYDFEKALEK